MYRLRAHIPYLILLKVTYGSLSFRAETFIQQYRNHITCRVPGVSLVTRVLEYSHLSAVIAACMAASTRARSITSLSSSDKEDPPPFFLAAIGIFHSHAQPVETTPTFFGILPVRCMRPYKNICRRQRPQFVSR